MYLIAKRDPSLTSRYGIDYVIPTASSCKDGLVLIPLFLCERGRTYPCMVTKYLCKMIIRAVQFYEWHQLHLYLILLKLLKLGIKKISLEFSSTVVSMSNPPLNSRSTDVMGLLVLWNVFYLLYVFAILFPSEITCGWLFGPWYDVIAFYGKCIISVFPCRCKILSKVCTAPQGERWMRSGRGLLLQRTVLMGIQNIAEKDTLGFVQQHS